MDYYFFAAVNCVLVTLLLGAKMLRQFVGQALTDLTVFILMYGGALVCCALYLSTINYDELVQWMRIQDTAKSDLFLLVPWIFCLCGGWLLKKWLSHQMVSKPGSPTVPEGSNDSIQSSEEQMKHGVVSGQMDAQVHVLSALTTLTQALQSVLNNAPVPKGGEPQQQHERMLSAVSGQLELLSTLPDQVKSLYQEVKELRNLYFEFKDFPKTQLCVVEEGEIEDEEYDELFTPLVAVSETINPNKRPAPEPTTPRQPLEASSLQEKVPDTRPRGSKLPDVPFDVEQYVGKTQREVFEALRKSLAAQREQAKEPDFLNDREKELGLTDLAMLAREWKSRNPKTPIRDYDYRNIGRLTREEADLPRRCVKQIIQNQKKKAWMQAEKAAGREVKTCAECGAYYPKGKPHKCFPAGWSLQTKSKGLPARKDVFIAQSGEKNVKISQRYVPDEERMTKQMQQFQQYQIVKDKRARVDDLMQNEEQQQPAAIGERTEEVQRFDTSLQNQEVTHERPRDTGVQRVEEVGAQEPDSPLLQDGDVDVRHVRVDSFIEEMARRVLEKMDECDPHRFRQGVRSGHPA